MSMHGSPRMNNLHRLFLTVTLILTAPILYLVLPVDTHDLVSHARPIGGYGEAVTLADSLIRAEKGIINPLAGTIIMADGEKVHRAVVLFHGYTRCPVQFERFGRMLHAGGCAVLIPRVPHHGLADRMTGDQRNLTAEELAAFIDLWLDIAHGYGDSVTVAGFSMGGVMAAWAAQTRRDVVRAAVIAPVFGVRSIPSPMTGPVIRLALLMPNIFLWWDPVLREASGPYHTYPRISTRALAEIMRMGCAVRSGAVRSRTAAHSVRVVTNAGDFQVNNQMTADLVRSWRARGTKNLVTWEIPADMRITHELFEPERFDGRYEKVFETIRGMLSE